MKGTRPLDNDEIRRVSGCFTGTYEIRNRSLFMLGVSTGGRISELLSLRVGDVYQNRSAVSDLLFKKSIVKGKENSRAVPVNQDGRRAIDEVVRWHRRALPIYRIKTTVVSIATQRWDSADAPSNRARHTQKRLSWKRDSTDTSRHIHCGSLSPRDSTTRQATSIWCKSCWAIETSPRHRST